MPTFAFNPPPGWPELPADWVPSLGWGPHVDWAAPDGWVLWARVPDSPPAAPSTRPLFSGRKQADELAGVRAENRRLLAALEDARVRERTLELVRAEYETVRRGLDDIGALEPLDLLLRLNMIGAEMQAGIDGMGSSPDAAPETSPRPRPEGRSAHQSAALRAGRTRLR